MPFEIIATHTRDNQEVIVFEGTEQDCNTRLTNISSLAAFIGLEGFFVREKVA